MTDLLPRCPSNCKNPRGTGGVLVEEEEVQLLTRKWYFSKEEIENCSPSRKDGISYEQESHLRKLYCSYLQELGVELKVPQVTIATAVILCHRFYMSQSHAKTHWQTIAAVSMFLACKSEETPRLLNDFVVVAYKLMYKWDPSAPQRIRQREVYHQQKELIILGERLLLATVAFDLNIEQPYKPLVVALKKLQIPHKDLAKVAWNFVNDMLHTPLCLQYKPPYIAAGSVFLAAKLLKVKLPKLNGSPWWMQFDVSPRRLEEAIQQIQQVLGTTQKQPERSMAARISKSRSEQTISSSPESCISSVNVSAHDSSHRKVMVEESLARCAMSEYIQKQSSSDVHGGSSEVENRQPSDHGSANCIVEDGDGDSNVAQCDPNPSCKSVSVGGSYSKLDVKRISEMIKRRRIGGVSKKRSVEVVEDMDEIDSETWIERELENGIVPTLASPKKQRIL